jgi:regulatory protein
MTISRIQETKRGRMSLFDENDEFLFSIDTETLAKTHIKEGTKLSPLELDAVRQQSDERKAKDKALYYISMRDYASKELFDKLALKFDADTCAAAVAEMQRLDLINDAAFAVHRAKYLAKQNKSVSTIKQTLAQKGISKEDIAAALDEATPADDDACCAIIKKSYMRKLENGDTDKVIAAMARRGFSYGAIKAALERVNEEDL